MWLCIYLLACSKSQDTIWNLHGFGGETCRHRGGTYVYVWAGIPVTQPSPVTNAFCCEISLQASHGKEITRVTRSCHRNLTEAERRVLSQTLSCNIPLFLKVVNSPVYLHLGEFNTKFLGKYLLILKRLDFYRPHRKFKFPLRSLGT